MYVDPPVKLLYNNSEKLHYSYRLKLTPGCLITRYSFN
jgi:hypothetical protein